MQNKFEPSSEISERIFFVLVAVGLTLMIVKNVALALIIIVGASLIYAFRPLKKILSFPRWVGILLTSIGIVLIVADEDRLGGILTAIGALILAIST